MKQVSVLLFTILIAGIDSSSAQQIKRCNSAEYLQSLQQNFPAEYNNIVAAEQVEEQWIANHPENNERTVVTIPVVVHVVYYNPSASTQNISDAQIQSQIARLNLDYHKLNTDWDNTPSAWLSLVADPQLQFCLATRDPSGNATNGITRHGSGVGSWSTNDWVKESSQDGEDGWPSTSYLNIWVCNLSSGILGYAAFPGGTAWKDGVVITYKAFGTIGTLFAQYNLGRTSTHEIGHWLGLRHTWGDDADLDQSCDANECVGSDMISDTPNECDANFGGGTFPITDNCSPNSPGVMFMNYMDYSDDAYLYMFTNGQSIKMTSVMNTTRMSLKTSQGCTPVGIFDPSKLQTLEVFPNPSKGFVQVGLPSSFHGEATEEVFDAVGKLIQSSTEEVNMQSHLDFDLTHLPSGFYYIRVSSQNNVFGAKVLISK